MRQLRENPGCEGISLNTLAYFIPSSLGGKKLRLQLEKSYLHTTFMFLKLPTRLFKHVKYFLLYLVILLIQHLDNSWLLPGHYGLIKCS